jgi:hypothetical protein
MNTVRIGTLAATANRAVLGFTVALILGLLSGCRSASPAEQMSDTAIVLNRTPEEIHTAVKDTFERHQFEDASSRWDNLLFQKKASFMNDLMSSDWAGGPTWVQVKVLPRQLDAERTLLDYQVYLVQQPDDPMFKTGHPYGGHKKEFKNIINEVARSLNEPVNVQHQ